VTQNGTIFLRIVYIPFRRHIKRDLYVYIFILSGYILLKYSKISKATFLACWQLF